MWQSCGSGKVAEVAEFAEVAKVAVRSSCHTKSVSYNKNIEEDHKIEYTKEGTEYEGIKHIKDSRETTK